MKLKRLKIENFRNIKSLELEFNEITNEISGKNGIGKTSVIDSIMWLLCDETYVYGKQNEENKNKNNHKATIYVKGVFENYGRELVLERTYFEKWNESYFEKNENQFKINGAKYKATEYFEKIRNEIGLRYNTKVKGFNLLRCLIDTNYLDNIDYKIARKFIEEMLDLESDENIAKRKEFENIYQFLYNNAFDIEKTKAYFVAEKKQAENEITKLENEVNLLESMLIDDDKALLEQSHSKLEELEKKYQNLIAEKTKEKLEQTDKYDYLIKEKENDYNFKVEHQDHLLKQSIEQGNTLDMNIKQRKFAIKELEDEIKENEEAIDLIKKGIEDNKNRIEEIKKSAFVEVKCPECGCVLNNDQRNDFEKNKHIKIQECQDKIDIGYSHIESLKKQNVDDVEKIKIFKTDMDEFVKEFENQKEIYQNALKEKETIMANYNEDEVNKLKVECSATITKINFDIENIISERNDSVKDFYEAQFKLTESVSTRATCDGKKEKINEQKGIKAKAELCIDNIEKYKKFKLQLTRENTKKVFPNIEFEMLEISPTTGVVQECCHATYNNVQFSGVNNGKKYLIGVEVIEDIKNALNVTSDLPIIFDRKADIDSSNYKELHNLTKSQIINTIVSDEEEITIKGE